MIAFDKSVCVGIVENPNLSGFILFYFVFIGASLFAAIKPNNVRISFRQQLSDVQGIVLLRQVMNRYP